MESSAEEDLWQQKDGEANAGSVGKRVWRSGMDGRDKRRVGEKNSAGRRRLRFNGNRWGGGPEGGHRVETEQKSEKEGEGALGAAWSSAAMWARRGRRG
jgi:hypothetical protein